MIHHSSKEEKGKDNRKESKCALTSGLRIILLCQERQGHVIMNRLSLNVVKIIIFIFTCICYIIISC